MVRRLHEFTTDAAMEPHLATLRRSLDAYPVGGCPLTLERTMLQNAASQSCGKCTPCRDGLPELERMMGRLLDGRGTPEERAQLRSDITSLAELVRDASDCAIGWQPATTFLEALDRFSDEVDSHVEDSRCLSDRRPVIPCRGLCPAHVDVPGYIALIDEGDNAGAVNLIRERNPLPTACALICEAPCESHCRRRLVDDAVNIRGLKEYAVDHAPADEVPVPRRGPDTGCTVAVVGGGPSGLTAAWFLSLMGHRVVLFDRNEKLGGMLRYGIPNYRFPKDGLASDIDGILAVGGIEVRTGVDIGRDVSLRSLREDYDAVYLAVGAQRGQELDLPGKDADGVLPAVDMLHNLAEGRRPDFRNRKVVVVGGGNVAMDATRTAIRCGAADVHVVYRRRREDMTALPHEIQGAVDEGAEFSTLLSPDHLESDELGHVRGLWAQPQMVGPYDRAGRPRPVPAELPLQRIAADRLIVAVGQAVETEMLEAADVPCERGRVLADDTGFVAPGVYSGGDCVTGPSTVIAAIAAGQVAARRIDEDLGYHHAVDLGVTVPAAGTITRIPTGRVEASLRRAARRRSDFEYVGLPMTDQGARQEVSRCLRCDHYGAGALVGGRI